MKTTTKIPKANCDHTLECIHGSTKYLNNSMTHSEERDNFEKCRFEPTAELKGSNFFKNINNKNFDKLPTKPTRAPDRQVVHGTSFQPNWWKHVSEETTYPKNNPTEFLSEIHPQDVCKNTKMTEQSSQYSNDELDRKSVV